MAKSILFVTGQLGYGGSEKQLRLLAGGLRDKHDIKVLCVSDSMEPHGNRLLDSGVAVIHPKTRSKIGRARWLFGIAHSINCDVSVYFSLRNTVALGLTTLLPGKVVWTERSLGTWKSRMHRLVDGLIYRQCAAIVANSDATADFVRRNHPTASRKVRVVYNGIGPRDAGEFRIRDRHATTFCLVSGFRPWKGHEILVEAAAELAGRGALFKVLLVGDGPTADVVRRMIKARDLDGRFEFAGWQEDPSASYHRADVNLNVSSHESMSNSVMEGMAHGLASIVTDVGGNRELVSQAVHGLVIPPSDKVALADAMEYMITNRDEARRFGEAGRRRVLAGFSVESMIRAFEDIICAV